MFLKIIFLTLITFFTSHSFGKTITWLELQRLKHPNELREIDKILFEEPCQVSQIPFSDPNFKIQEIGQSSPVGFHVKSSRINRQSFRGELNGFVYDWSILLTGNNKNFSEYAKDSSKVYNQKCTKYSSHTPFSMNKSGCVGQDIPAEQ